ncbi:TRAP transporter small permease [Tardiphaga sp. 37S4]|jgi:TRAP-type C4-dicarboxylate transport system permease small subunit|uniref:TRAP transporter small permease n=1 Tax=unclassified Tardiphaga TaxID=2631404 RepID=UPI000B72024A|nr:MULTISPECIES: TRAP transporter small permease [unclassified Tardiphaga]UFS75965.1 TRAP transporter small permease [Tardiphaga sp. 37S4]SNT50202.1 TRAP-type C4-dicarboxylate transport system, small permease component [Tardiphaga sp. OK246]
MSDVVSKLPAASSHHADTASHGAAYAFRRAMNALYWTGAVFSCLALVLISAIIPWAVYTRYILNSAASWPEPLAVLLTIAVTFIGAANCYRQRIHMNMTVGTNLLPPHARVVAAFISELLMAAVALFMVIWGMKLVMTTWGNSVDEFPWLSVGITYMPIPVSGAMMFLFVVERLTIGPPPQDGSDAHIPLD